MAIKLLKQDHQLAESYVRRWFWNRDQISEAALIDTQTLDEMLRHGCAPGIIYSYSDRHGWWSALSAYMGEVSSDIPQDGDDWYSPASLWWLRRSLIIIRQGKSLKEAAQANRQAFEEDFVSIIRKTPKAKLVYPNCFDSGDLMNAKRAQVVASDEWNAWIAGAYGVCLRDFSAASCIRKETIGGILKAHFDDQHEIMLQDLEILSLAQELSALITPFAPWERPTGTPGRTIDAALGYFEMGNDHPYPFFV